MFPTTGTIFLMPMSNDTLYAEQQAKVSFWSGSQPEFYGVKLGALEETAKLHHFSQPVVGYFDPSHDTAQGH